jgi:site-specific DNA-methyltransferase (adenine-specific)
MGSGSAGEACLKLGDRKFIGIELDDTYFEIAKNRMEETEKALKTKF